MSAQFKAEEFGGKGASLMRLQALGYPVPSFVVIPASHFEALGNGESPPDADSIAASFGSMPDMRDWEAQFGQDVLLAVRSSATLEDGALHSFAGQFSTELNVSRSDLPAAIARVWLSGFSGHVKAYKSSAGLSQPHRMAVIVQEMVPADAAGVGFGMHPLKGSDDILVINAVPGLGEALVSGAVTADTYEVDSRHVISRSIIDKAPVLSDKQVLETAEMLRSLRQEFGAPQDIEFAYHEGRFYLLQSRPVTTTREQDHQQATVWDNSNIIESYPGLTLPLTFSFIEKMYAAVYRQFTLVLGVREQKVEAHNAVFASMLGLLNGRVYYNLNSWYAALALLPGYSVNARFMEGMMGVKEAPPVPMPARQKAGVRDYLDILRAVTAILGNLRRARTEKDAFIHQFNEVYAQFSGKDFGTQEIRQTWQDYKAFESMMLARWKAPLVNDFFAMIYFGLLKKLCAKFLPYQPDFHNQLVGASKDIITTQPLKLLPGLAAMLTAQESLKHNLYNDTPEALWKLLQEREYQQIRTAIEEYLNVWGERCVAELKLETVTYLQEPAGLIAILQSYIRSGVPLYKETATDSRSSAETRMLEALRGRWLHRRLFRHVLDKARYFISNRENLRYFRTRGFGLVRRMMTGIGSRLHAAGLLEYARDIFYLSLDEVSAMAHTPEPLQAVVSERKNLYERYAPMHLPERIILSGPLPDYILAPPAASSDKGSSMGPVLQGIPCSAGVVRARVRMVHDATSLASLGGGIMATYATDPGYVVVFPTASGILTERGSLLSHAAIVSREMGIPCIVGIDGLMQTLQEGDEIVMDGKTGIVQILTRHEQS